MRWPGRPRVVRAWLDRARARLPRGGTLPDERWANRHRVVVVLLYLHAIGLSAFALARGNSAIHSLADGGVIAIAAVAASSRLLSRTVRSAVGAFGLVSASAVLIHLSGGVTEAHFHVFVVLALLTLYQDWAALLLAVAMVVLHHGVVGSVSPTDVFEHASAIDNPWAWTAIHAAFVLAASAVNVFTWHSNEVAFVSLLDSYRRVGDSEATFRHLFASNPQPMWVYDLETLAFLEVNDAAVAHYGYSREVFLLSSIIDIRPPEDIPGVVEELSSPRPILQHGRWRHQLADGRIIDVEIASHTLVFEGRRAALVAIQDVTERNLLETQLRHQAFHDPLTGLPNRALLLDRADHALAQRSRAETPVTMLLLDLDGFKTINDSLGHTVGDDVLVAVADRLRQSVRPGDTAARLGGDEFAVLLGGAGSAESVAIGERIIRALKAPLIVGGMQVYVDASIGLAHAVGDDRAEELLRNADAAMYQAKSHGRGTVRVFESAMHADALRRMEMGADLHVAIDSGQLVVHYQPIVVLPEGEVVGVEALVRWNHPTQGLVGPDRFIRLAEETGHINALGRHVLAVACRQVAAWNDALAPDRALSVSVNASVRQIEDPGFFGEVVECLAVSGLAPATLCLEITESIFMDDLDATVAVLRRFKDLGVRLAIDDFGTGYSSLSYLRALPIDSLKIDRSFVDVVTHGQEHSAVAEAVIKLARTFGLRTVAEGVETPAQATMLTRLGCDLAQGYLFSRPVPAADATPLIVQGLSRHRGRLAAIS